MPGRGEVFVRLWAFIWANTFGYALILVAFPVGIVFGIIDLIWQLLLGGEGISDNNFGFNFFNKTLKWIFHQNSYAVTGNHSYMMFPEY